ncbi:MAG: hypothetical protein VYA84_18040 [Planctomycetota bacterium]|nr:hypothetical protein [Planctomycetota bacterium]
MCTLIQDSLQIGNASNLPQELVDFARRQVVNASMYKGDRQRRAERQPMLLQVLAVAVDAKNQPLGETFNLITRDISRNTIGLIYTEPLDAYRLVVQFSLAGTDVTLATELVWSRSMGPFYGCACRYVDRLDHLPVLL